ncbi:MAG: hypothetical protein GX321_02315 [Clostridiales bacterium]|nr:hypothetical protein [Clostridiales bacterium]
MNLKSIYKNLINNRNLEKNIPDFMNDVVGKYYAYASVQLALLYYTYYEMYCDDNSHWDRGLLDYSKSLTDLVADLGNLSKSGKELEDKVKALDKLRDQVKSKMDVISSYRDLFEIYEYALNRVEYRFKSMEDIDNIEDDEEFAKEVLRFIFDSDDNVQINELIKEVIGQLPIRITRQKFFDYLSEGLYELTGVQEATLDTYIYIIRSRATLDITDTIKEEYPDLWSKKEALEGLDFKEITKKDYEEASALIEEVGFFIDTISTAYYVLMEVINQLYVILICASYVGTVTNEEQKLEDAAFYIINDINKVFYDKKAEEPSEDILKKFESLEGYLEYMDYELMSFEDGISHIDTHHRDLVESLMEEKLLNVLLTSKDLLSGSVFIDLRKNRQVETVNKEKIQKEIDKLIEDFDNKFKKVDRMIVRAIMANTINRLPVFFKNHTEVMDYVLYSLSSCTDKAEKYACKEIINYIMAD